MDTEAKRVAQYAQEGLRGLERAIERFYAAFGKTIRRVAWNGSEWLVEVHRSSQENIIGSVWEKYKDFQERSQLRLFFALKKSRPGGEA